MEGSQVTEPTKPTRSMLSGSGLLQYHNNPLIFLPSAAFLEMSDTALSLPNAKQIEAGDYNLAELTKKLTEALNNKSQRNVALSSTGESAVLLIECLENVSEPGLRS
jgi:hypothetical protein